MCEGRVKAIAKMKEDERRETLYCYSVLWGESSFSKIKIIITAKVTEKIPTPKIVVLEDK